MKIFPTVSIGLPVVVVSPRPTAPSIGEIPLRAVIVGVCTHNGVGCGVLTNARSWPLVWKVEEGERAERKTVKPG